MAINKNDYKEYTLTVGDTKLVFFSSTNILNSHKDYSNQPTFHSHQYSELFFVLDGEISLISDFKAQRLKKNDMAIIPPNYLHYTLKTGSFFSCVNIGIKAEKINKKTDKKFADEFNKILDKDDIQVISNFNDFDCFNRFMIYNTQDYNDKDELITSCLYEIVFLIKNAVSNQSTVNTQNASYNDMIFRDYTIDNYTNANFNKGATITELAEILHISTQQLQRIMKKLYNQSFSERILTLKMKNAKNLLKNTDLPISEIASQTGYSSPHGFYKAFKQITGTTPSQFRNNPNFQ